MFKVETYQDPVSYYNKLNFKKDELHISAVAALSNYLKKMAAAKGEGTNIYTYRTLQGLLYPKWNQPLTQVMLASLARHYLREFSLEFGVAARSMEKSVDEIVYSFRYAVETGVKHLIPTESGFSARALFQQLFQRLINDREVRILLDERENIDARHLYRALRVPTVSVICVYQMYRVTAPIMLFFHRCRNWGIPVVFRIPYYQQYPNLSRGWNDLYEVITQQSFLAWTLPEETSISQGTRFISFFEGKDVDSGEPDDLKMKLLSYPSPVQFRQYLSGTGNRPEQRNIQYAAPSADSLNMSMRDIIRRTTADLESNSENEDSIFFHYPFGKFLFFLYECKKQGSDIRLEYDVFVECLISGWIETRGVNGIQAAPLLRDLEPYMEGAKTIAEIKERLDRLEELADAGKTFDSLAREQVQRDRTKGYLTNPFRAFSYLLGRRYSITIKQLQGLSLELERVLLTLLPDSDKAISIKTHLGLLLELWQSLKESSSVPDGAAKKLERALTFPIAGDWKASSPEIRGCLAILLSLRQDEAEYACDEEPQIHSLEQLDGLILDTERLHITDLSINSLVDYFHRNRSMPGYLSHSWLKESIRQSYSPGFYNLLCHCLLVDYTYQQYKESFFKFSLFNTLSFFNGTSLTVSWINKLREYDDASVFFKVLYSLYGGESSKPSEHSGEALFDFVRYTEIDINYPEDAARKKPLQANFPALAWLDLDFCPRKFFFSNVLRPHPMYESDFHQRLVFAVIGSLLVRQANGWQGVKRYLFPMFPHWPEALKENLIRTHQAGDAREYLQFQNISYPKAMDGIQKLRSRYTAGVGFKIKDAYSRGVMKEHEWIKEFNNSVSTDYIKPFPGRHCGMCPHQLLCKEGEYAIDGNAGFS